MGLENWEKTRRFGSGLTKDERKKGGLRNRARREKSGTSVFTIVWFYLESIDFTKGTLRLQYVYL